MSVKHSKVGKVTRFNSRLPSTLTCVIIYYLILYYLFYLFIQKLTLENDKKSSEQEKIQLLRMKAGEVDSARAERDVLAAKLNEFDDIVVQRDGFKLKVSQLETLLEQVVRELDSTRKVMTSLYELLFY